MRLMQLLMVLALLTACAGDEFYDEGYDEEFEDDFAEDSTFDGIWYTETEGIALEIANGTLTEYTVTPLGCGEYAALTIFDSVAYSENDEEIYELAVEGDSLDLYEGPSDDDYLATFEAVDSLPTVCDSVFDGNILRVDPSTESIASLGDLEATLEDWRSRNGVPGLALAIVSGNRLLDTITLGNTATSGGSPIQADTPFLMASVSKTITATAVVIAADRGTFNLDDPIDAYLPFTVDNPLIDGETITIRHLLTHTSGLVDGEAVYNNYSDGDSPIALSAFMQGYFTPGGAYYDEDDNFIDSDPGNEYVYSNVGTSLSGYVVEAATGIPFATYTDQQIFTPLGMTNTSFRLADFPDTSRIALPIASDGTSYGHYGFPTYPDGGLRSSVEDMAAFMGMIMNNGTWNGVEVISAASIEAMLSEQTTAQDGQGLIWYTSEDGSVGHSGGEQGTVTEMYFLPDQQVGVVFMMNSSGSNVDRLSASILELVFQNAEVFAP
ncbi:MAG: beta-lactamase family protein [Chloroflexi bacterium]|nr:beta-lactamase family protein [Chloroflexota bacterium]